MATSKGPVKRGRDTAIGVILWVIFLSALAWRYSSEMADSPVFIYWSQVLSGNWSPDKRPDLKEYGGDPHFMAGLYTAIAINLVTLGALIKLAYEFTVGPWSNKVTTTLKSALRSRDVTTEKYVMESIDASLSSLSLDRAQIESIKNEVHRAFKVGPYHWETETLPNVFKGSRGERIREFLSSII